MLQHYMNQLPSKIGKKVIYEIYINDKTEAQVAQELHISQQVVNKWKRKMIRELSRKITS
ncbi:hypothetical protein [Paenibacillus sp. UNC217MF]|uniref:hypothetical protein n=1 Tax=Paenibacillus sp. UNC217MF TaxID=1449062 RepID=UPI0009DD3D73